MSITDNPSENKKPELTGKALSENQLLRILNAKQKAVKKLRFIRMLKNYEVDKNK